MTPVDGVAPAPSRLGRSLLAALVALPLAVVLALGPGGQASADHHLASIDLTTLDPSIGVPGARLRATGVVRVTGNLALTDVEVRLRLSRTRLNSRGELPAVVAGRTASRDGEVVASQRVPGRLTPGQQTGFDVAVDLADVGILQEFGVHVLNVEVVARSREGVGRAAIVRTFLPWVPADRDFKPAGFAWLWPLVAAPARLANGRYADDGLAAEMDADGRLGRLTAAGARLGQQFPLTWVVDPALLETAEDMSDGYSVQPEEAGDPALDGTGAETAAAWLDQVRAATGPGAVVTLPYADPDLVGLRRVAMTDDIRAARVRGDTLAAELLARGVVSDVAWPADGFVDRPTLQALRAMGTQAVILNASAIPAELTLPFTPAGRANIGTRDGRLTGLLYDPVLTTALAARTDEQPLLAAQRFVAETAMITAELPGVGPERTILIAPPRRWSPTPELLDRVVTASLQAPWLSPASVEELRATRPPEIDREPLRYPRSARLRELPAPYLDAVQDLHTTITTFSAVLSEPEAIVPGLDAAVLRLESTWWRNRDARLGRLTGTRGHVLAVRDQVQVLPGSYTFGSKSGTIPVTVSNNLSQAVTVDIGLTASPPRLRVGAIDPVRINAESKVQVEVPATAVANGPVVIRAVLRTPTGNQYGQAVQLRVQVTQFGTVALVITGVAAAVLFATAGFRLFRRAASARRTPAPHAESPT